MISKHRLVVDVLFITFWVLAICNFFECELFQTRGPIEALTRYASQVVIAVMGLALLRARVDFAIIGIYAVVSFISTVVINHNSIFSWVDGSRLYFFFLFFPPIFRYIFADLKTRNYFVRRFDRTAYIFLWLQVPCMLIQVIEYRNNDLRGGSLGWMMSGILSSLLYFLSFYLMMRRWDKQKSYFANLKQNWILIFLLFPSFMNETKVSFIYLALYFILLIPIDKEFFKRMVYVLPVVAVLLVGAGYLYSGSIEHNKDEQKFEAARYLLGDDYALELVEKAMEKDVVKIDEGDIPRGLMLGITPSIMNRYPNVWTWGFGVGQYKTGESSNKSFLGKNYNWLIKGTMTTFHLTWLELGLLGIGLYIAYWIVMFRTFGPKRGLQRNRNLTWFLILCLTVITFYQTNYLYAVYCIPFYFLLFISMHWKDLPPYKEIRILGKRKIIF